jgi:imidazolonepropionase-like amidohydrolase
MGRIQQIVKRTTRQAGELPALQTLILTAIALLLIAETSSVLSSPPSSSPEIYAFVNITVLPMDWERVIKAGTVVVRGGRIVEVGVSRKVEIPEGAVVINGRGLYLMPGLADMHVHLGNESDMKLFLANGVTTVRNMRGSPIHLYWRDKIAAGEMIGPRIITAGPILDGYPPSGENVVAVQSPEDGRVLVQEQKRMGYDFIKIYTRLSVPVYQEILRTAKENGMQVAGHIPKAVGLSMAISEKQDCVEHLTGFMGAIKVHNSKMTNEKGVIDSEQIPFLAMLIRNEGVWNCVTLLVQQRYASINQLDSLLKLPEMKYVSPARMAFWDPTRDLSFKSLSQEDYDSALEGIEVLKTITKTLQNTGAKILMGTDSPSRFVVPGFSAHEELKNLVDSGLSPFQALKAATSNAAEFLGPSTEFGTIEKGKSADLLILRADPLEDIRNTRQIYGVMVHGNWLPESRIQEMLAEVIESFQTPKDRFSNVPEPPSDVEPIFSARYSFSYGDVSVGEERIKIYPMGNNQKKMVAQQILDHPFPSLFTIETIQEKENSDRKKILFQSDRPDGRGRLAIEQNKGAVRIDGNLPYMNRINYIAAGPEKRVFGTSDVSSRFSFSEFLNPLKVGQTIKFSSIELDFGEIFAKGFALLPAKWSITRKPDSAMNVAGALIPVRIYQTEIITKYGTVPGILVLDSEGMPVKFAKGAWQFQRVE